MLSDLKIILERDLDTLARELDLYPDDESVWKEIPGCPNSGGNLVLHLVGNLRHFIGAKLGATGYVRTRDAEFSTRGLSRQELRALIAAAKAEVSQTMPRLDAAVLAERAALPIAEMDVANQRWLLHIVAHLGYHIGQLDYHRRTVTGNPAGANAMAVPALAG